MPSHPQTSPALFISVASGDPRSLSHSRRTHLSPITLSEAIGPVMKERPKSNLVLVAWGGQSNCVSPRPRSMGNASTMLPFSD